MATEDGRLYFANAAAGTAQWSLPEAWGPLLGRWQLVEHGSTRFWCARAGLSKTPMRHSHCGVLHGRGANAVARSHPFSRISA